jgi:RimK family alpha-L-glutamate ligase
VRYSEDSIVSRRLLGHADENSEGAQVNPSVESISTVSREQGRHTDVWLLARRSTPTNERLLAALRRRGARAELLDPARSRGTARRAHVVVGRLDVRPTLDGVEDGIWELRRVEGFGIRVLNPASSLLASHDKLQTALRLAAAGVPHPSTGHIDEDESLDSPRLPVVVKPRFGSWGRDVVLCETQVELERLLERLRRRPWFQRNGALVQEVITPLGFDLRLLVAGGRVVGAIERVAAAGEWRTNIALGGSRRPVVPPPQACALAIAAADAVAGDLVGVDLLPRGDGSYVVLEVNGAVEFTADYSLDGREVFDTVAAEICAHGAGVEIAAARPS